MGRMNPAPMEATVGSNVFAVAAAHREYEAQRFRRSAQRFAAIERWVAARPELCVNGEPCPFAHWAAETVRDRRPDLSGEAFVAAVIALHRARVRRLYGPDAERYLAGEVIA